MIYRPDGGVAIDLVAAAQIAERENAVPDDAIQLPNDIRPSPGAVLLVRIGDTSGYWSKEAGIVKVADELKEMRSPYAQIVRVGPASSITKQEPWFGVGDYVIVNHSLLDPVEVEGETFWLAPYSAIKAVFFNKAVEETGTSEA